MDALFCSLSFFMINRIFHIKALSITDLALKSALHSRRKKLQTHYTSIPYALILL